MRLDRQLALNSAPTAEGVEGRAAIGGDTKTSDYDPGKVSISHKQTLAVGLVSQDCSPAPPALCHPIAAVSGEPSTSGKERRALPSSPPSSLALSSPSFPPSPAALDSSCFGVDVEDAVASSNVHLQVVRLRVQPLFQRRY